MTTIYVDDIIDYGTGRMGGKWCHMWTDGTEADLNTFALKIGLKLDWAQYRPNFYHYDLRPSIRTKALKQGAVYMDLREWIKPRLLINSSE